MSADRSRFSGTLSLKNRLNQFQAAMAFWFRGAGLIGAGVTIYFSHRAMSEVEGATVIYLRFVAYRFLKLIGEDAQSLLPPLYRLSSADGRAQIEEVIRYIDSGVYRAVGYGFAAAIALLLIGWFVAKKEHQKQTSDAHVRGALVTSARDLTARLKSALGAGVIRIGEVLIPRALEPTHFFFAGRPGVGKTVAINAMLDKIVERGDRALVWCAKGEDFLTTHFRDGDQIFCPGDARSLRWSLMADITSMSDFDLVADALVDDTAEKTKVWSGGAKQIIAGLLRHCYLTGKRTNRQIWDVFCGEMADWHEALAATPGCGTAAGLVSNPKSQTCLSFFVTVCLYSLPLRLLAEIDGDFRIQDWVREGKGRIYLPANPRLRQSLRAVHSLFIELSTIHHLSTSNDRERRIWYLLDELPALPPMKGLPELANTGRSKGASLIVGTQSFAQLDQAYGAEGRRALHNACATSVVFSVADKNTATELSDHLGKAEVEQSRQNLSIGFLDTKDSVTAMTQKALESLYLPDQIKDLPILTAIVKVLGFPAAQTQLKPVDYRRVAPEFVVDPRMSLETYLSEYQERVRAVEEVAKAGAAGGGAGNTVEAAPPAIQTQASPVAVEQGADLAAIADDF
ncbi:hypothetical protein RW64_16895 [Geobacter sulfurreducens]|nr:hypothetical protein RW64_16895 [Geobacter sulfurreducens]